jgi:hypothetical protein
MVKKKWSVKDKFTVGQRILVILGESREDNACEERWMSTLSRIKAVQR